MRYVERPACVICASTIFPFFSLPNFPQQLCCVDTPSESRETLTYAKCSDCNTIQLQDLIPLNILYASSHNTVSVGITWSNYFKVFVEKIASLVATKCVLEIGDPSARLALALDTFTEWTIVEPNQNKTVRLPPNVHFIETFFDTAFTLDAPVDVIVHSHVFEHAYDPLCFLRKCHELLKDSGEMFFGIPDMDYIYKANLSCCLGVFFEHTVFMNTANVVHMLNSTGFRVLEITNYVNHSTLYHVRKGPVVHHRVVLPNLIPDFMESILETHRFVESLRSVEGDLYIFGASYNTQFLLSFDSVCSRVRGILDNCTAKQGKYFYGHNLLIYDPEHVRHEAVVVIVRNGYYSTEIIEQLKLINPTITIVC